MPSACEIEQQSRSRVASQNDHWPSVEIAPVNAKIDHYDYFLTSPPNSIFILIFKKY